MTVKLLIIRLLALCDFCYELIVELLKLRLTPLLILIWIFILMLWDGKENYLAHSYQYLFSYIAGILVYRTVAMERKKHC